MIYVFRTTAGHVIEVDGKTKQEAKERAEKLRKAFKLRGTIEG